MIVDSIKKKELSYIKTDFNLYSNGQNNSITNFTLFKIKNSLYGFNYIKYGEKVNPYTFYENPGKKIFENNTSESRTKFSGFGYQNDWLTFQLAKGHEEWGAGDGIELALSNKSQEYDYFKLGSNYGNLRVLYIHGFLETTQKNINRYITSRGIEWTNKKTLIIGFSETVIYSGLNRSIDIGYFNPLSSHLEIELNNRLNNNGVGNANGVWQIHSDLLLKNRLRISANYLYDEFVLDPDIEIGKEHGNAYSFRILYTLHNKKKSLLTFYGQKILIGTPTFRHSDGSNNFIQKSQPIGYSKGSDIQEISIGSNYTNKTNFFLLLNSGITLSGDENIIERPYDPFKDYLKENFPSGKLKKKIFLNTNFELWIKNNISISFMINLNYKNKNKILLRLNIKKPWLLVFN